MHLYTRWSLGSMRTVEKKKERARELEAKKRTSEPVRSQEVHCSNGFSSGRCLVALRRRVSSLVAAFAAVLFSGRCTWAKRARTFLLLLDIYTAMSWHCSLEYTKFVRHDVTQHTVCRSEENCCKDATAESWGSFARSLNSSLFYLLELLLCLVFEPLLSSLFKPTSIR